jgi:hypothetical protein
MVRIPGVRILELSRADGHQTQTQDARAVQLY